jgi:hypothetical protein
MTNFIMKELKLKGQPIGQNLKTFPDNIGQFLYQTMTRREHPKLKIENSSQSIGVNFVRKKF